ncbi:ATP-binding protein [Streptoverticillium reticulum]|uniref:ATP-binding protein n=1 Tax=Streptoverticillium reticulum TaxID=1433415 RepID=UPI0039BF9CD2
MHHRTQQKPVQEHNESLRGTPLVSSASPPGTGTIEWSTSPEHFERAWPYISPRHTTGPATQSSVVLRGWCGRPGLVWKDCCRPARRVRPDTARCACEVGRCAAAPVRLEFRPPGGECCVLRIRRRRFAPQPESVGLARDFVVATLASWGVEGLSEEIRLCVSELASNALVHGTRPGHGFVVRLAIDEHGSLRLEVRDCSSRRPQRRCPADGETSGRGLQIVYALADRWGVEDCSPSGKIVWAFFTPKPSRPAQAADAPSALPRPLTEGLVRASRATQCTRTGWLRTRRTLVRKSQALVTPAPRLLQPSASPPCTRSAPAKTED